MARWTGHIKLSPAELRERWRREELCTGCGTRDSLPDRVYCDRCQIQQLSYKRLRIASGRCVACSNPRDSESIRCQSCRELEAQYQRSYRQLKREVRL